MFLKNDRMPYLLRVLHFCSLTLEYRTNSRGSRAFVWDHREDTASRRLPACLQLEKAMVLSPDTAMEVG